MTISSGLLRIEAMSEWTVNQIEAVCNEIRRIVEDELGFTYYPMQIEIITAEQMVDIVSAGLPVMYPHWSWGKRFLASKEFASGVLEIVINTNPCRVYCMETNTMTGQAVVLAHAGFGHNTFFANNYLFNQWTHPDAILDYMVFAQKYILDCEERYGIDAVEEVVDACHALQNQGIDRYAHPRALSLEKEEQRQRERAEYREQQINILWRTFLTDADKAGVQEKEKPFPQEPEENILYFFEKNTPNLPVWKREIMRIVRKLAQYDYPYRLTKLMNEGFATFVHYYVMNRLYDKGFLSEGAMQEFLHLHTNVAWQIEDSLVVNPYRLGFTMFMDIKRICQEPTPEDIEWSPDLVGKDWIEAIGFAMKNFKDESFILQYLSPRVIREYRMFSVIDDASRKEYEVSAIHRSDGYDHIRQVLASHYDLAVNQPVIEVVRVAVRGDRTLTLRQRMINERPLEPDDAKRVLLYAHKLWQFPVELEVERRDGSVRREWRVEKGEFVK